MTRYAIKLWCMEKLRIQKIIADSGYCSRRKAEELIQEGRVKFYGRIVSELGFKCFSTDEITIDDKPIPQKKAHFTYLALNKPLGYVSTLSDPQGRKTVKELIPAKYGRLFPVGRLDFNSAGLIIMTDDGEFANLVSHPSSAPEKEYIVTCKNPLRGDEVEKLEKGIYIKSEGYKACPAKAKVLKSDADSIVMSIIIHEGKKREVRHMMETLDHPVYSLVRVRIASLELGQLKRGEFRVIDESLIQKIKSECLNRKKHNEFNKNKQ